MSSYSTNLVEHVEKLCANYRHLTGRELVTPGKDAIDTARNLEVALFAVVSHDVQDDPIFNYGNNTALELFEMSWDEFTTLPSRLSAEVANQVERAKLLDQVSRQGYVDNYSGIRISKSGRRFMIKDATVWNLYDAAGKHCGQAALIRNWTYLP